MQPYVITLLLLWWAPLAFGQPAATDESPKLRVYVWEFATQNAGKDAKKLANQLTNDFETELIQSGFYTVLEIRELSRLEEQRALQDIIFNINELSDNERQQLQVQQAEAVFFGKLIYDEQSKQITLEVKLQHLDGRILRKGSIYLNPSELIMNKSRRAKIHTLFTEVHAEIFEAQRQALLETRTTQIDLITEKAEQYIRRVEDLTTQFRRLDLSMLSQQYLAEYVQSIESYDAIIADLLEKHSKYASEFAAAWDTEAGEQLREVFEQIMDFHNRFIHKSLNKRNEQITRFAKTQNKKERQKLQEELKQEQKRFAEAIDDHWPVVKTNVQQFLRDLRRQLN